MVYNLFYLRAQALKRAEETTDMTFDLVRRSLVTMMKENVTSAFEDYLTSSSGAPGIEEIRVVKGERVINDPGLKKFGGKGTVLESEKPQDELDKNVLATGQVQTLTRGDLFRRVIPVVAELEPCLDCHNVEEGDVMGAISVSISLSDIRNEINNNTKNSAILVLGSIIAVSIILSILLSRLVVRPVRFLSNLTTRIGRGEYDIDIPIVRSDEIGDLTSAFNKMTYDLKNSTVSKDYMVSIMTSMMDSLIVIDLDKKIKTVNRKTCKLLGYSEAELIGVDIDLIVTENVSERIFKSERFQKFIEEGSIINYEMNYKTKDGATIPMLLSGSVLRDKEGKAEGILVIARDITERVKAEEEIVRLASFPELNPNPIIETDQIGTVTYLNGAAARLFPDLKEKNLEHPMLIGLLSWSHELGTEGKEHLIREVKIHDTFYQQIITYVSESRLIRIYALDITERKKAEEEIVRLASFPELNPNPIIETDQIGTVTYLNSAAARLFPDLKEKNLGHPMLTGLLSWSHELGTEGKDYLVREVKIGDTYYQQVITYVLESNLIRIYGLDITERKEIDKSKDAFLASVSHELRTPLTSVLGFARIIQKRLEDRILPAINIQDGRTQKAVDQVRGNIDIIVAEGERLTALINNILDLTKIEAGQIEWQMKPLSLSKVVDRAQEATSTLFAQNGLELITDIPDDLPQAVGDCDRLIQVMINLISNAVKFTPKGSVTCRSRKVGYELITSVIDTGIGIGESDQSEIFERFKQVTDTLTDKPKGTGLGLPICKEIIEHHGGRIWIESELGKGSNFSFSIPVKNSEEK